MNNFEKNIIKEISKLKIIPPLGWASHVFAEFIKRINQGKLLRQENPSDHFCVFFLPVDYESKSVYLVDHIKADDWIPPGGHIENFEHPVETVKREIVEELNFKVNENDIKIFDLTIKDITNLVRSCRKHWDIWYLIPVKKRNFKIDMREFRGGKWFTVGDLKSEKVLITYPYMVDKIVGIFKT